jgi:hypothetical protein
MLWYEPLDGEITEKFADHTLVLSPSQGAFRQSEKNLSDGTASQLYV